MLVYEGKTKLFDHSYMKELSYLIKKSYEEGAKVPHTTSFSYKLEKFLIQHRIFEILDIINCVFSSIITIFYIISTYTRPEVTNLVKRTNKFMGIIETILILYPPLYFF